MAETPPVNDAGCGTTETHLQSRFSSAAPFLPSGLGKRAFGLGDLLRTPVHRRKVTARRATLCAASSEQRASLTLWDWLGMGLAALLIFAVPLINGQGRIFWEDETLGWVLLRDPSWQHMLHAWRLGADGGGIVFYVLGRAWFHLFGEGVLAFRLFSATAFSMAVPVVWSTLRRFYPLPIVAFATFNTLFFSPPLTMHFMEGRFYGLLFLGASLAFASIFVVDAVHEPIPRRYFGMLFAVHLFLTGSHVLGVLYSATAVLAMVLLDRWRGRRRPLLYLSACASWLVLLWEAPAIRATALVGKPYFWTKAPSPGQIIGAFAGFSPEVLLVFALLVLAACASLPRERSALRAALFSGAGDRFPLCLATGCLFLVPCVLLLEGLVGTWLFTDRYLQPLAIGTACVTAELSWRAFPGLRSSGSLWAGRARSARALVVVLAGLYAAVLLLWVFHHEAGYTASVPDFTSQLSARIPQDGTPVVVEDTFTFTELMSRPAGATRPYRFLLDWNYALSETAPRMEVTQFNLMQNWKRAGYFAPQIAYKSDFLRQTDRFYVLSNSILGPKPGDRPEKGNPLVRTLTRDGAFYARQVLTYDRTDRDNQRDTLWLLSRKEPLAENRAEAARPSDSDVPARQ